MKISFNKLHMTIYLVSITVLLGSVDCFAKSADNPIVIRKKVHAQRIVNPRVNAVNDAKPEHKRQTLSPKSNIATIGKEDKSDGDAAKLTVAASNTFKQKKSTYKPGDKIDPFEPLFKEKPEKKATRLTSKIPDRQNVTAIEKLNLNQLKLTGIIFASSRKLALVQEASGKGHIISVGTHIGTRGGTVSEIQKNKIVIQETLEDAYGNTVIQKNELKLNNKPTV
jgi:type IV pilus assembly protein PilP